ncbi:MAG TPA: phospholipid carrier-dependent glycosyltransferase [Candidatus Baltobacteraceae bacterium]|nr:phospholipid carrier-dependent glycosyltransferase [Candidatus Baltobacteraceae bacterium]
MKLPFGQASAASAASAVLSERSESKGWALPVLLAVAFLIRVAFIPSEGFKTDVSTFEAWAMSLAEKGFANFYGSAGFADYPPGYFYILAVVGHLWELVRPFDGGLVILRALVKMPAILADLGVGALLYAIARRFSNTGIAIGAAALYLLNPAVILNSAMWGQVDSVSGGLALLAVYLLLRSDDADPRGGVNWWIVDAWLAFAYSLLIKPQAAVLLPLILAFAFVDPARRRVRLISTGVGIVGSLFLALVLSLPFHPSNPIATMQWLLERYSYGSNVYAYNSVNAFNLWALRGQMWIPDTPQADTQFLFRVVPQYVWGIGLVVAAVALTVWRYVQEKTPRALLESCAVATIAFFILATRMHERYLFNGVVFTIACLPLARRYLWSAVALSVVLFANLAYSLQYLTVVTNQTPGVDPHNMWGLGTVFLSALAVGTFFYLGYTFLGSPVAEMQADKPFDSAPGVYPELRRGERGAQDDKARAPATTTATLGARKWFDPREGLTVMRWPLDYAIAGALGLANFVLSFIGYWWPPDKVFDEIYFARAGEEYLQNLRIYENTHPPLSKLLVTFSMMLFGGMPKGHGLGGWTFLNGIVGHMNNGDNSYGWRFLDVVFGALVVMLLYAFAKRITGSTLFAAVAALLLGLDGMHFVQSRIATPEGFVVFFATFVTYAFYRFWISSQVGDRRHIDVPPWGFAAALAGSAVVGVIIAFALTPIWGNDGGASITVMGVLLPMSLVNKLVLTFWFAGLVYLTIRYALFPRYFADGRREVTFAEGSFALADSESTMVYAADGGTIDSRGKVQRGANSQNKGGTLVYREDDLTIEYHKDASVSYETPVAGVTYADDEIRAENGRDQGRSSKLWLILFTVALGLLVGSKWYGVMGFGVSFVVLIFLFLQRYIFDRRPTQWGNPRGFRLDGALVTIVFVSATIYALSWVPDLARHSQDPNEIHNANDVVYRQYTMFMYHDTLKATHPYSSKWWEWPLDYVPVAYFYQDHRKNQSDPKGCCVYEITSMPNPMILWFGLICVPWVAVLAWRERNKGYALIVLTYLMQWLPWMQSPRITFAYHFYVNIPLICICIAVVLQRLWEWGKRSEEGYAKPLAYAGVAGYVGIALVSFIFFYPILAAHPIPWDAWHQRMWIDKWIIGPG